MKIRLVCYEDPNLWILGKFAKNLENNLKNYEKIEGTVGLGYRVPMIIASPWTKGGFVNSEVSDHTSVLQFLENFIMKKYKKNVHIDNISDWRRAICGDLTSAFNSSSVKAPQMDYLDQKDYAKRVNCCELNVLFTSWGIFWTEPFDRYNKKGKRD